MTTPCMGGWCTRRDHCANYHAASVAQQPAERLCPPGQDGAGLQPLDPSMIKFSTQERIAQAVSVLVPAGVPRAAIGIAIGVASPARLWQIMSEAERQGLAFSTFARVSEEIRGPEMVYFPTEADRDAFRVAYDAKQKLKLRERELARYHRRAATRPKRERTSVNRSEKRAAKRAEEQANKLREVAERKALAVAEAEQRKQRARLEREAKAAEQDRQKREAESQRRALRAMTKAAGKLGKQKGTASPAPAKPRGPAMVAGELDLSRAKVTVLPAPRGRFEVDAAPSVINSRECRAWAREAVAAA